MDVAPYVPPGPEITSSTLAPFATGVNTSGYRIEVDAGLLGRFEFVARPARRVGEECFGGSRSRWIGVFEGGFVEAEKDVGVALWETMGGACGLGRDEGL